MGKIEPGRVGGVPVGVTASNVRSRDRNRTYLADSGIGSGRGVCLPTARKTPTLRPPTPIETKALAAYKAAKEGRGPRLKVTINASDAGQVEAEHPNIWVGTLALMQAIGTTDLDFFDGLMRHLVNAGTGKGERASEQNANFMLAVVKGIEPRDQIEAMLAAQMAAVHNATMTFARRLAHVDIIPQQDSAQNAFNKLARTFAAQVEALKRYRSGGEQKMTVQHVHVAEGGQAIVGNS